MLNLSDAVLRRRVFNSEVNKALQARTLLSKLDPFVDQNKTSIDVGAATGHITHYLAPRSKRVWSLEAVDPVFRQLQKKEKEFSNVQAFHAAVSDYCGMGTIYVDDKRLSNSGFQNLVGGPETTVPVVSLDSLNLMDVGFIKIDVEGTEFDVLRGAEKTLAQRPNLMVEIYEPFAKHPLGVIFEFFFSRNYDCYFYSHPDLVQVKDVKDGVNAVKTRHAEHDGDFLFAAR